MGPAMMTPYRSHPALPFASPPPAPSLPPSFLARRPPAQDRLVKHAFLRAAGRPTPEEEHLTYGEGGAGGGAGAQAAVAGHAVDVARPRPSPPPPHTSLAAPSYGQAHTPPPRTHHHLPVCVVAAAFGVRPCAPRPPPPATVSYPPSHFLWARGTYPGKYDFLDELEANAVARLVTRKPVEAGEAEVAANPRSRSAKLRVLEKLP